MTADLPPLDPSDPSPPSPPHPVIHPRWILIGSLSLIAGLLMGFIMSSLGK